MNGRRRRRRRLGWVWPAPGEEASAAALHLLHLQSIGCLLWLQAPQPEYKTDFQSQENEFGPKRLGTTWAQFQLEVRGAGTGIRILAELQSCGPGVMYLNNLTTQARSRRGPR